MTDLDPAALRANERGWSKEAIAADAKVKRDAKRAAARAKRAAFWKGVGAGVGRAFDFFLRHLLVWIAIAGVVAIGTWEWWNTSRGWHNLYPGLPPWVPYVGAFGAVVLYFFGFRQWRELGRADKSSWQWLSVTVAAYFVCVAGVYIATATAAEDANRVARESRRVLEELKLSAADLETKVDLNDPEILQLALDADRRTLKGLTDTAKGTYGMPDLEVREAGDAPDKHGCPAPPRKFQMERFCAQANGGIDPFTGEVLAGIRLEIQKDEKRLKDAQEAVEKLRLLKIQIRDYPRIQGDETAAALAAVFNLQNGTNVLAILLLALSSAFLYGGGWMADWVVESIERMRLAAAKRKAPA